MDHKFYPRDERQKASLKYSICQESSKDGLTLSWYCLLLCRLWSSYSDGIKGLLDIYSIHHHPLNPAISPLGFWIYHLSCILTKIKVAPYEFLPTWAFRNCLHFIVFDSLQNSSLGPLWLVLQRMTKNGRKSLPKVCNALHKILCV